MSGNKKTPFEVWNIIEDVKLLALLTFKDDTKIRDIKNSHEILEVIKHNILNPSLLNVYSRIHDFNICPVPTDDLNTWFTIPLKNSNIVNNDKNKNYVIKDDMVKYREDIVNLILNDYDNEPVDIFRMCKYLNVIVSKGIKYRKDYLYNVIKKICIGYRKGRILENSNVALCEKVINLTDGYVSPITYMDYLDTHNPVALYLLLSSQYNSQYVKIVDKKFVQICVHLSTDEKIRRLSVEHSDLYICLMKLRNTRWSNKTSYKNMMNKIREKL